MKSLIVIVVFAALGVFAYGPRTAPAPQVAAELSSHVNRNQVSPAAVAQLTYQPARGCTGNCCEVENGVCVLCARVCP